MTLRLRLGLVAGTVVQNQPIITCDDRDRRDHVGSARSNAAHPHGITSLYRGGYLWPEVRRQMDQNEPVAFVLQDKSIDLAMVIDDEALDSAANVRQKVVIDPVHADLLNF
jgi:hypothetical protein